MRRILRVFIATLVAFGFLFASGQQARAENETPSSWRISRYDATVTLAREGGVADVELRFDFDFARDAGHGPFVTLPTRQRIADPDKWLELGVTLESVTSPSGASAETSVTRNSDGVLIRIGSESRTYRGVQSYVVRYRLTGLVAANHSVSGMDEFNWNLIGPAWQVPLYNVSARVQGPGQIKQAACFWGSSYDKACNAEVDSASATYSIDSLPKETPLQIVAGFPPGTFTGTTQTFSKRYNIGNMFPVNPATGGATAALAVGGWLLVRHRVKRYARDEAYLGLAPGMAPGRGQGAAVGERDTKMPIVVQFQPPKGARPGELGTLLDAKADNVDVTASVIDLAVRGYITINPRDDGDHTFALTGKPHDDLVDYERQLLQTMFKDAPSVTTDDLKDTDYAELLTDARSGLYRRVVELRWFRGDPRTTRLLVGASGVGLMLLGVVAGFLGSLVGWGLIGLAGLVVGIILLASMGKFTARTADGSAMLAQTKGFELYLSTAEANQIKFEEGIDVFSRYLPYAIIFGVADRWVQVFKTLEQAGVYHPDTSWYGGTNFYMFNAWSFSNSMDRLTESMSSAMSSSIASATAGSSGGSGFSGGGGFGGGGGGGW